jgi:hypothetical protein
MQERGGKQIRSFGKGVSFSQEENLLFVVFGSD